MLSAINKDATVNFTYDNAGRLLSETLNGKVTSYSYDVAAGKRTLTYPSGMKVEEHLNARDLITSILQNGDEVVTMAYNAAGQKTTQGYANGITTTYGYNENGWLSSIVADHDIMNLQMSYDPIGNMTERKDMLDNTRTESYGYDVISQLTSSKRGTTVDKSYQFDLLGNRVKVLENGIATNYTSNNVNAYTNITVGLSFTPQYDDNGNMLNDDKHTYAYDFNNKLVSVDETVGTYKYDALGRRIAKDNTLFYYVGDQMVEDVTDGVTKSYLYGNNIDEALLMRRGEEAYYYHANHLGSTMSLSDKKGKVDEKIEYDVYGVPIITVSEGSNAIENAILYTGREYDEDISMYYFRARMHFPILGRFVQKDPLLYIDGMNDFSYVMNNPILYIDKNGLGAFKIVPKLLGQTAELLRAYAASFWKGAQTQKKATQAGETGLHFGNQLTGDVFEKTTKGVAGGVAVGIGVGVASPGYTQELPQPETPKVPKESLWDKAKNKYDQYDQWGKDTYRYSANWWFRLFHGGQDYNGCNGLFDPDDFADLMWLLTSPI